MEKNEHITRVTADEAARRAKTESRTNWERAGAMTAEEIEAQADADDAELGIVPDWNNVMVGLPETKAVLNMRVDRDVLDFFRSQGKGYQSRINAVLRTYMDAQGPK